MKSKEDILDINIKQKEFYNNKATNKNVRNLPSRIWKKIRETTLKQVRRDLGILDQSYNQHKNWFGDLSNKKVLDLGCYAGNFWSIYLAENSKEYIAIDLSNVGIDKLKQRIEKFRNAKAVAQDFLSDEFQEKDFDIIYAYGVLHHFENTDILIKKLNEKLSKDGLIISYDPLETSLPIKIIRTLYRPFQSDKDWEWPFTKKTFYKYNNSFNVVERHGVLGKSKWIFLLNFLPISKEKKINIGKKWHNQDWNISSTSDNHLFSCMQLTMLMQKK